MIESVAFFIYKNPDVARLLKTSFEREFHLKHSEAATLPFLKKKKKKFGFGFISKRSYSRYYHYPIPIQKWKTKTMGQKSRMSSGARALLKMSLSTAISLTWKKKES
jgi:hypothetical protein